MAKSEPKFRERFRKTLYPTELEIEEWVYQVQLADPEAGTGMIIRCMIIAVEHPDWPFWSILDQCKRSCEQNIQLPDMLESALTTWKEKSK